ncbi:amino acid adenylation domain-containing protein [Nocardiopsis alba]|uniref:non-ribosomal peptide synthetase n=1 Tax=Nocardiopsis alba TaxID=53437 RepID=UPI0033F0418B
MSQRVQDALAPADPGELSPLTPQQRRVWAAQSLTGGDAYHIPARYRLHGPVDLDRLERVLRRVLARHPVLRLHIVETPEGELHQRPGPLPERVVTEVMVAEADLDDYTRSLVGVTFGAAPPARLRACLIHVSEGESVLVLVFDHLAVDGVSVSLLMREIAEGYEANSPDEAMEPEVDYFDYARRIEDGESGGYWSDLLANLEVRSAADGRDGGAPMAWLDLPTGGCDVKAGAARLGASPFALLLTAWGLALRHHEAGRGDLLIGYPAMDGSRARTPSAVGLFSDLLVHRCPPLGEDSSRLRVREVQRAVLDALEHQGREIDEMWSALRTADTGPARVTAMLSLDMHEASPFELSGIETERAPFPSTEGKADLMVDFSDRGGELAGRLGYASDRYDRVTACALAEAFSTILRRLMEEPDTTSTRIPLCSSDAAKRARLSRPPMERPFVSVTERFLERARETPEAVALVGEGHTLTYGRLEESSRRLAARLAEEVPDAAGGAVALYLPRGVDYVIAALAVLRRGAAFLPVDVEEPTRRTKFLFKDVGVVAIITDENTVVPDAGLPARLLRVRNEPAEEFGAPGPVDIRTEPEDPAYVIATSGTTGLPKPVVVPHRAICNNVYWKNDEFGFTAEDRFHFKTPTTFDASIWEFLSPLTVGASVVVAPPQAHRDPAYLLSRSRETGVTVLQFVPTLLREVLAEPTGDDPTTLRWLFAGGEALEASVAARAAERFETRVVNLYGPTETTIDASFKIWSPETDTEGVVSIGGPLPGTDLFVLGAGGQAVPVGMAGELHIGGASLATGYLNRAGLTARAFVSGPDGSRVYRSGDLVRVRADGEGLDYLGRLGDENKVRGIRIDLGGLRHLALQVPGVSDAVSVVSGPDRTLVLYVITAGGREEVHDHLSRHLPSSSMPSWIVCLERMPVTGSGKVDFGALPRPETGDPVEERDAPSGDLEHRLAGEWSVLLGLPRERIPRNTGFFALGGDSLKLIRLHRRLRTEWGVTIAVTDLFKYTTVSSLAGVLSTELEGSV